VEELELEGEAIVAPEGVLGDEADGVGLGGGELGEALRHGIAMFGVWLRGAECRKLADGGEIDLGPFGAGDADEWCGREEKKADWLHALGPRVGVAEAGMSAKRRKGFILPTRWRQAWAHAG